MRSLDMKRKLVVILQLQVMLVFTSAAVCPFAVDLAFLLDASGSIGQDSYMSMKIFINEIIDNFHVSDEDTHIGVVSFGSNALTEILFTHRQNVDKIKASILGIKYYATGTRMDLGLQKSHKELFSANCGRRENVPQILLAITDGKSQRGYLVTKKESQHLKDDRVVIFAMGLGSSVNSDELKVLASQPSHVFQFSSARQMSLADNALKVALALCSVGRTSTATIFPVVAQHSLRRHTVASRITYDDLECILMCITHSSCYSFNFHLSSHLCELSYARKDDFMDDFSFHGGCVYNELGFKRVNNL